MRLIDADAFKEAIGTETKIREVLCEIIDTRPTAYDLEKVVAELEEARKKNFEAWKEATDILDIIQHTSVVNAYGDAISVVKRGGVE